MELLEVSSDISTYVGIVGKKYGTRKCVATENRQKKPANKGGLLGVAGVTRLTS